MTDGLDSLDVEFDSRRGGGGGAVGLLCPQKNLEIGQVEHNYYYSKYVLCWERIVCVPSKLLTTVCVYYPGSFGSSFIITLIMTGLTKDYTLSEK